MRTKIALIVALASLLAAAALGTAMAGADPVGDAIQESPLSPPAPAATTPTECANGLDDDEDGLVDLEDPSCTSAEVTSEQPKNTVEVPQAATPVPASPAPEGNQGEGKDEGGKKGPKLQQGESIGGDAAKHVRGASPFGDGGAPTLGNPTTTLAPFGPAPIGVPNFIIDSFEIPPFLLPIYQACGTEYGVPWEVLASINKIETGFGTNLNVSTAGALGWMQFLPSSWEAFGVDANGDGKKDPYNPVDAICAAASYLEIAGAKENLYDAIFAYNHADWYVQEVLLYARAYGRLPSDLVGSLTGLTEGAHFPIAADARYADDVAARAALKSGKADEYGTAAEIVSDSPTPRGINIFAAKGSPVVAVNDGVVRKIGHSEELGNFVVLEDTYGNRYTYAALGELVRDERLVVMPSGAEKRLPVESEDLRPRLRANPGRVEDDGLGHAEENPQAKVKGEGKGFDVTDKIASGEEPQEPAAGGVVPPAEDEDPAGLPDEPAGKLEATRAEGRIKVGSKVIAGTVLARVGAGEDGADPHINFSIRPAGKGAPRIDPKPILDGWKLLEATAIYRSKGKNPFTARLSGAGVLLLSKEALIKRVLADKGLSIYECGREDVATGRIDRRVLAMLEYLRAKGFELTVTSLNCGHGFLTTSGNVSEHSTGDAVDIAAINGVPVLGHQGPGSITSKLIAEILRLQGTMQPHQVISLEDWPGPVSFPLSDHADHVHVGYHAIGDNPLESRFSPLLKPDQWERLISRLGEIENPEVAIEPSPFSLPDEKADGGTSAD